MMPLRLTRCSEKGITRQLPTDLLAAFPPNTRLNSFLIIANQETESSVDYTPWTGSAPSGSRVAATCAWLSASKKLCRMRNMQITGPSNRTLLLESRVEELYETCPAKTEAPVALTLRVAGRSRLSHRRSHLGLGRRSHGTAWGRACRSRHRAAYCRLAATLGIPCIYPAQRDFHPGQTPRRARHRRRALAGRRRNFPHRQNCRPGAVFAHLQPHPPGTHAATLVRSLLRMGHVLPQPHPLFPRQLASLPAHQ